MKKLALSIFVFSVLALAATALARLSQHLSARVGWPLIVLLAGGGLGVAAILLWRQRLLRSWPLFVALTALAGLLLATAEHYFAWRDTVGARSARQAEAIRQQPQFAALLEQQIAVPTWVEFMTPAADAAMTWLKWIGDAGAKIGLALAVLIVGRRTGMFTVANGTPEEAA